MMIGSLIWAKSRSLAIVGLVYQAARKPRWSINWNAFSLVLLYAGSIYVIYRVTL